VWVRALVCFSSAKLEDWTTGLVSDLTCFSLTKPEDMTVTKMTTILSLKSISSAPRLVTVHEDRLVKNEWNWTWIQVDWFDFNQNFNLLGSWLRDLFFRPLLDNVNYILFIVGGAYKILYLRTMYCLVFFNFSTLFLSTWRLASCVTELYYTSKRPIHKWSSEGMRSHAQVCICSGWLSNVARKSFGDLHVHLF
jgi:hypothetical protein